MRKNDFNKYRTWYNTLVYAIENTDKREKYDRILDDLDRIVPEWSNFIRDNTALNFKSYEEMQSIWFANNVKFHIRKL